MSWFDVPNADTESWRRLFGEFEIQLAQAVLETRPDHLDALHMLGGSLTRLGRHEEALSVDRRLTHLRPFDPVVHYNLACSLSNLDRIDEAFQALGRAIDLGYRDFRFLQKDPDLENVRRDPRYKTFLARAARECDEEPRAKGSGHTA
jgi:tetratricopeptide (TPR) repeat protein